MTSKESNDPILGLNSKNIKNDILMFKNEALKDFKDAQRKISERYQGLDLEIKEKLEAYETRITTYENKIMELSKLINTDKTIRDKVEKLNEFMERTEEKMLTEQIRLDNCRKDLNSNVDRIDQILKDSVIYPGVVGGISKYKTFHDLIDYVLTQCSLNLTFREKSILDFKGYKTKLENSISAFNTQINTLLNTTSDYTKNCVKELEEKIKSIFNIYDDRLQDTRIENANYAVGLERATDVLKKELGNLYVIKKELYEKVDTGLNEVKNDNTRVVKLFTGYKKNFHLMQHKFNQLSDFIKDIRFRINMKEDVKRREYSQMSDLINFDKKKKGFYDGVYDVNTLKKGFASQLKDYIEGRISADQLFKKKNDLSKSVGKLNEKTQFGNNSINKNNNNNNNNNDNIVRKSLTASVRYNNNNKFGEEVKLNFMDLIKSVASKRKSSDNEDMKGPRNIAKKETIKEEDDENNNSSKEFNSIFNKTLKDQSINQDLLEKSPEKNKEDILADKEKEKEKDKDKDKETDKKEKENINKVIKQKKEESKIQIVSKNIGDVEEKKNDDKEKEKENNKEEKKSRASMQNVISDLFNLRNIIENITNNDNQSNNKTINQNDKNKNSISKTNENTINNNLFTDIKKDAIKTKPVNKNLGRPGTVINIKKKNDNNEQLQNKIENIGIVTNNDLSNINDPKNKRPFTKKENKRVSNQDMKTVNVSIYNPTTLGDYIQTIHYKVTNGRKKANSSNQKNKNYFLKQNTNTSASTAKKSQFGTRKDETRTVESMFNNLNNYLPKIDINVDNNSHNYLGMKKRK